MIDDMRFIGQREFPDEADVIPLFLPDVTAGFAISDLVTGSV
jgi:hypothetical protein